MDYKMFFFKPNNLTFEFIYLVALLEHKIDISQKKYSFKHMHYIINSKKRKKRYDI